VQYRNMICGQQREDWLGRKGEQKKEKDGCSVKNGLRKKLSQVVGGERRTGGTEKYKKIIRWTKLTGGSHDPRGGTKEWGAGF